MVAMPTPEVVADRIDRLSDVSGSLVSWLTLAMVLLTVVIVVMRYVFDAGFVWMQESLTWMHAAVFMLGAAYTLQRDEHVRVDIFYRDMSERRRAVVDAFGVVLFLLPLCGFLVVEAWPYVSASWSIKEISRDTGGLPYPAIPLLKSVLLLMPLLVALQGVAVLIRALLRVGKR